jgi:hypothetical protein
MASKFFFKPFVTILVAPTVNGIIIHFTFYIHCISLHKLSYFSLFSASFCTTFLCAGIATSISVHVSSFFVFSYYIWPIYCNFSACVYPLTMEYLISCCSCTVLCVCAPFVCCFDA